MTITLIFGIILALNILSFIGCLILDYILRDRWMDREEALRLFPVCLVFGVIMLLTLMVIYVPIIRRKGK